MRELPKVELGEICTFQNGRAFKKTEWRSSGLPIIRIQNLNNKNAEFNYFDGEYDQKIEVNDGDLLFSWSGTVGSSFGPHLWKRGKGALNQHIFKVGLSSDIDRIYAFYVLRFVTAEIEKNVKGAVGLRHVTKTDMNKFKIPLPSLCEQKRIVAILDEAFAGIDTAIANTEKNLANARELFESYLNLVFTTRDVGWLEKQLSDVCSITSKLIDPRDEEYIDLQHVGAGNIISMTGELIQVQTARDEGLKSGKFVFDEQMVLYSKIRPYLMKVVRPNFDGLCSADIYPLKPNADLLDRDFLYYLLLPAIRNKSD